MAEFLSDEPAKGELVLLLLCHNLSFADVALVIDEQKSNSKGAGSHKRRQLYWEVSDQGILKTYPAFSLGGWGMMDTGWFIVKPRSFSITHPILSAIPPLPITFILTMTFLSPYNP